MKKFNEGDRVKLKRVRTHNYGDYYEHEGQVGIISGETFNSELNNQVRWKDGRNSCVTDNDLILVKPEVDLREAVLK